MPLAYVLDENLRGLLWRHIQRHNARGSYPLDVIRVGDRSDLPLGISDPDLLIWCENANRILVSRDEHTLPMHLSAHVALGRRSPGVFLARTAPLVEIMTFLVAAAYASESSEWEASL